MISTTFLFDFKKTSSSMARFTSIILFICLNGLAAGPLLRGGHLVNDGHFDADDGHVVADGRNKFSKPDDLLGAVAENFGQGNSDDILDDMSWSSILSQFNDDIESDEETIAKNDQERTGEYLSDDVISQLEESENSKDSIDLLLSNTFDIQNEKVSAEYGEFAQQTTPTDVNDFEMDVLATLGLPSRPRPTGQVPVPGFMKDLHALSDGHEDHCTLHHDIRGNIFRSIQNKGFVSAENNGKKVVMLRFPTSAITPVEIATHAEVKVRIDAPRGITECDNINTLQLSLCHRGIGDGDGAGGCDVAQARSIGVGTFSADFKVADDILKTVPGASVEDIKFVIRLNSGKEEVSGVCLSKVKAEAHLLLATYDSASCMTSSRQKRSMRGQYEMYKYPKICHMRPYKVDFRTIGWSDWVLAPARYEANRCYGECPFPITEYLNGTNHAILQTLFHSHDDDIAPETCCVPVDYKSISILYIDHEENVVLRKYKDMVVTSCGCR